MRKDENRITGRAFLLGLMFSGLFAGITVYASDRLGMFPTATQIPVLPYVLLFACVLLINPLCGLVRVVRRFTQAEILIVFMMGLVSSGVSTFGLTAQLVPVVGGLFNRSWNTEQSQWNRYVVPFVNESWFLSVPGLQTAAAELAEATAARDAAQEHETAAAELAGYDEAVQEALATLEELEREAFARVEVFRRGLPRGMRAYPGIIKLPGDSATEYMARVRRMMTGRRVTALLFEADALLVEPGLSAAAVEKLDALLARVAVKVRQMSDTRGLEARVDTLAARQHELDERIGTVQQTLAGLHRDRREAPAGMMRRIEREAAAAGRDLRRLQRDRRDLVRDREYIQQQIDALKAGDGLAVLVDTLRTDIQAELGAWEVSARLAPIKEGLPVLDGTLRRFLAGDVPWGDWLRPLARWSLLVACTYLVLMAFNVLVFRQWAHNEKLIYPLAELPMALTGVGDADGRVPSLYRSGLFWAGAALPIIVLGYNILVSTQLVPGLRGFDLYNDWAPYIRDTALAPLLGGRFARSHVFFTMIGLAFLIPTKVSFSLWFFAVLSMAQVIVLVALGYGQNELSFPHDWWYTLNFRTSQGFGALMVFSTLVLYKCRAYLVCAFSPQPIAGLPTDERRELRAASAIFLAGSIAIVMLLWRGMGAHPVYALVAWLIVLIITIGLVRAVAEGGILGFQAWVSPFHAIRTILGMQHAWSAPPLFAPLMVWYAVLFLDIKTFIAPAMANSLKIRDSLRMRRGRFHAAILLAVALAVVVSVAMSVMMSYDRGADLMQSWFFTHFPRGLFSNMADMARTPPDAAPSDALWMLAGGTGMALLLFFRRSAFWLPHPIGMIMLVNPMMGAYWFSILLGWIFKSLVTKYGNKESYATARKVFIGLIAGELLMVVVGMLVGFVMDIGIPVGLNRN